jgi:hypothetical protein
LTQFVLTETEAVIVIGLTPKQKQALA